MANRKPTKTTSSKQSAAARRTKKTSTPVKKAPPKKAATETATSGKKTAVKTAKTATKTAKPVVKTAISGKKPLTDKEKTANSTKLQKAMQKNFVRLAANAGSANFSEMGERVKNGEIKWAFYAVDGDVGYHYYEVLK